MSWAIINDSHGDFFYADIDTPMKGILGQMFSAFSEDNPWAHSNDGIAFHFIDNISARNNNFDNVEDFMDWLETNNVCSVAQLVTPIETPLSDEELAAYRVLHTYDSTTVITTDDALAEVEVDYLVKSKAYIEKKLTAIESRLNALEISEALEGE